MSRKNLSNFPMFGSSGASIGASVTSTVTNLTFKDNVGIIVTWTGTSPVGELFIECANGANDNNLSSWVALDFGSSISISGNSGSHEISCNQLPYDFIRARYVRASGTGTILASLTIKQVGA